MREGGCPFPKRLQPSICVAGLGKAAEPGPLIDFNSQDRITLMDAMRPAAIRTGAETACRWGMLPRRAWPPGPLRESRAGSGHQPGPPPSDFNGCQLSWSDPISLIFAKHPQLFDLL